MAELAWQTVHIPLAAGVNQKADDRALQPPALAIARDAQWEEHGGIQTRRPFVALGSDIAGSASTIANTRRLEPYGDEFVLMTKDTIYSWHARISKWVARATHLAVATEERTVHATAGDQIDGDRAELGSLVVFAWSEADVVYVAAADKDRGAVFLAPTAVGGTGTRPRLVALSTRILLFWHAGTDASPGSLLVYAIDPTTTDPSDLATDIGTPVSSTVLASPDFGSYYDAVRIAATDTAIVAMRRATTTSYELAKVTAAAAVSASTKARTCTGPIAVSVEPTGASVQVIRQNSVAIEGDFITISSLADVTTGQAIGTAVGAGTNQIAAAHRSTQDGGAYRCYVFWHDGQAADTSNWYSNVNFVDTAGTIGTEAVFIRRLAVASRAFDHDGRIYVWLAFAGTSSFTGANPFNFRAQVQNTYFLYRDDGLLVAKAAAGSAAGFPASTGLLPGVTLRSGSTFAWCAGERRIIPLGGEDHTGYADRGPREISFTFDDNRARRVVRLGRTLYLAGGEVKQFDGTDLVELGFHLYPWTFGTLEVAAGNLADGVYTHKATWRSENAQGETDRSTTATHGEVTIASGPNGAQIAAFVPLYVTHKAAVTAEVWRTQMNPPPDAPFYLATSNDPTDTTNPNRYLANDPTASVLPTFNDELADSSLIVLEQSPENGEAQPRFAPPPATIIATYGERVFLGGVPGDRRIWYSLQRRDGEVVAFHPQNVIDLPLGGGELVALSFLDGILVALCERAIYMVPGEGYDNAGGGNNYGPAREVRGGGIGCRDHDSVVETELGIMFHSHKGTHLLNTGWTLSYIGGPVVDFDAEPRLAAHVDATRHQVRWLTASRLIMLDLAAAPEPQWSDWTITNGVHAALLDGTYYYLAATGPLAEQATYTGTAYGLDVETPWIAPAEMQGRFRVRKMKLLGEHRAAHHVKIRISYDHDPAVVDTKAWESTASVGEPIDLEIMPSRQEVEAVKVRITVLGASTAAHVHTDGGGAGELSDKIAVLSPNGDWTAILTTNALGDLGNSLTFSIAFVQSTIAKVTVNNHAAWDIAQGKWVAQAGNLGVLVTGNDTTATVTVAAIEAAINAESQLGTVTTPDPNPTAVVDFATMTALDPCTGPFHDGAFAAATGESLKLTSLALEVAPLVGLHKRLPPESRV